MLEEPHLRQVVDFTGLPQARGRKYLFVFVCASSDWREAFSVLTERVFEVIWLQKE